MKHVNTKCKIEIKVIPSASRDEIVGLDGGAMKIKVTAPPDKGKANKAVEKLLAAKLKLPKSAVSVVTGFASRRKTIELTGISEEDAKRLMRAC